MFELTRTSDLFNDMFNNFYLNGDVKKPSLAKYDDYQIEIGDDGKLIFRLNVVGHEPETISVESKEQYLFIKSNSENLSHFATPINTKFRIHKDYDLTKSDASIKNGILTILFDKKEEVEKSISKIEIKY
jgi:HSP20 family molecular chaperone IbpA